MNSVIYNHCEIRLTHGNIITQEADVIVNAANRHLSGGGGVDGAIHRAGGSMIMAETRDKYPYGCATGEAVISTAGNLHAKYVVHAVAPRYSVNAHDQCAMLLYSAYFNSLLRVSEVSCKSVVFPSLGTGIYGNPLEMAVTQAFRAVRCFLDSVVSMKFICFVLYDEITFQTFSAQLNSAFSYDEK